MILKTFYISENELSEIRGNIFSYCKSENSISNAFSLSDKINIAVKIPRKLGISAVKFIFYNSFSEDKLFSKEAIWQKNEGNSDIYIATLDFEKNGVGLYHYDIEINSIFGIVYAQKQNDTVTFSKNKPSFKFQITISEFIYDKPIHAYGGIIYHIFVDRFAKSKKTSKNNTDIFEWDMPIPEYPAYPGAPIQNTYLYGGNLWGIAEKLEYLKELGVSIIYLSPIFESPSNHKYDTSDYMTVDSEFGGEEALVNLIKEAEKFGIKIILDGVFNHTGSDSKYFNKLNNYDDIGAYNSPDSKYFEWYDFQHYPDKYTCWWGIEILPRINPDIPSLRNYITGKAGVLEKYMSLGILGMRLDVVDELSDDFIKAIKVKLNQHCQTSYLIGEVWEDASNKIAYGNRKQYYIGSELDGVMNYPIRAGIIDFLKYNSESKLKYALNDVTFNAPKRIRDLQMNVIGTHDTERIITILGGKTSEGKSNDDLSIETMTEQEYEMGRRKLLMAYTFLATIPGIPSIYYGDEVGLQGYSDPFNRRTFPWDKIDHFILNHYKKIGKIRRENEIYKEGNFKLIYIKNGFLIFSRYDNRNSYITVLNNTNQSVTMTFSDTATSLLNDKKATKFELEQLSSEILKIPLNTYIEIKNNTNSKI